MRTVFLTSGPRGSGKSRYAKAKQERYPETIVISRDEILISLFGETSLSPYEGGHQYALEILFQKIEECLSRDLLEQIIILDCWNGFSRERKAIIQKLKELGADRVFCLYFITSLSTCLNWFKQKSDSQGYSEHSIRWDYQLYHKQAETIEEDGFDEVIQINPLQSSLPGFPFL